MLLDKVPGQSADALVDHGDGPRGRSSYCPPAFRLLGRGVF